MKTKNLILCVLIVLSLSSPLLTTARLPDFTGEYFISNYFPNVSNSVSVTVYVDIYDDDGQQIPFNDLYIYLMWSRDMSTWVSITLTTTDFMTWKGVIPAQDGSDNGFYNYGYGTCYWYCYMTNNLLETTNLFSASSPNNEIYFTDPSVTTTQPPINTETENEIDELEDFIGSIFDPTADPVIRFSLIMIVSIIFLFLASRGRGLGTIQEMLTGLFKR